MKFSELWLREIVNPPVSSEQLEEQLTMAGLEVGSREPVAKEFSQVVVGKVLEVSKHPDADRLRVCQVDIGTEILNIVCGAPNVRQDLKVPVACVNAVLPGDFKIKKSKIRGVESYGMICSESELGIADTSEGIMELPDEALIGQDFREYLLLNDFIFDIELTPNRGDCLSVVGIAREVAAINKIALNLPATEPMKNRVGEQLPVKIQAADGCPRYFGCVIRNLDITAKTPSWMQERLKRSGLRPISLVVDVTNYVLLELGQPLHAFDLSHLDKGIEVRYAKEHEFIHLLDDQVVELSASDLIVTDGNRPIALAGIKGGSDSGITAESRHIFLESALFNAKIISRTARRYGIYTDSSQRFERGVDSNLQQQALERASALIVEHAGGEVGEIVSVIQDLPAKLPINLRRTRITKLLGISLADQTVEDILKRLSMQVDTTTDGWSVLPPSFRLDLNEEIDLIEEVARLYGYNQIPNHKLSSDLVFLPATETQLDLNKLRELLAASGYQEAITYSFVDPIYERILQLQQEPVQLINPISSDLGVMRTNHWPGLLKAYQYNAVRQQPRIRLFEIGLCFENHPNDLQQIPRLGGLASGSLYNEQWGEPNRAIDYYDIKGDLEKVFAYLKLKVEFRKSQLAALHPGKSADIYLNNVLIGSLGAIHPSVAQELEITQPLYLFDLNLNSIMEKVLPVYQAISKFPAIRRDLALLIASDVPAEQVRQKIVDSRDELLKNVQIFDIYQGKGIEPGKKSIALSLTFQHIARTLVDAEINDFMQKIIDLLHKEFNATLRD